MIKMIAIPYAYKMIILYFFSTLLLKSHAIPDGPFTVTCKTSEEQNHFCLEYDKKENAYTLSPCANGETCKNIWRLWTIEPNINSYSEKCAVKNETDSIIGSSLSSEIRLCQNSECSFCDSNLTSINLTDCCRKNNCNGKGNSTLKCKADNDCNAGFYCDDTYQCQEAIKDGAQCSKDEECKIGSGCNYGICTKLFSLNIGKLAQKNKFCKSNWALNGFCDGLYLEVNGMVKKDRDYTCSNENLCAFKLQTTGEFNSVYNCSGPSKSRTGLCNMSLTRIKDEIGGLFESLQYRSSDCSSASAHSDNIEELFKCGSITSAQYYNFKRKYYWMLFNTLNFTANVAGDENCANIKWLTEYSGNWTSYQNSLGSLRIFSFVFSLIAVFL
ncbi:unnamed protein product [Blepharisma stoltei]|uniref:Dickkopf N-terminal cysteine-rich domain-containing protein n=1 Tax=Blepharisma stoltei TaxID=1481888 RepID=A0AAU9JR32_9CILI|nr:unnamed protein product [Blepharisma stoltei]